AGLTSLAVGPHRQAGRDFAILLAQPQRWTSLELAPALLPEEEPDPLAGCTALRQLSFGWPPQGPPPALPAHLPHLAIVARPYARPAPAALARLACLPALHSLTLTVERIDDSLAELLARLDGPVLNLSLDRAREPLTTLARMPGAEHIAGLEIEGCTLTT